LRRVLKFSFSNFQIHFWYLFGEHPFACSAIGGVTSSFHWLSFGGDRSHPELKRRWNAEGQVSPRGEAIERTRDEDTGEERKRIPSERLRFLYFYKTFT